VRHSALGRVLAYRSTAELAAQIPLRYGVSADNTARLAHHAFALRGKRGYREALLTLECGFPEDVAVSIEVSAPAITSKTRMP
jgi:hypothetical protein